MSDPKQGTDQVEPKPIVLEIRKLDRLETTTYRVLAKG
jgi:hypothetical protein